MHPGDQRDTPTGRVPGGDLATVQVLLELKNSDPTALTAAEAIRHLLGFGDRLSEIRRRTFYEIVLRASEGVRSDPALPDLFSVYLERGFLWNPNRERAWVRIDATPEAGAAWEALPGARRKPGGFGRPDLGQPAYDHLLIWPRGRWEVSTDLGLAPSGWVLAATGRGELWSLRWRETATTAERTVWTGAVGAARSRREGLLFNPQAQDHRLFPGVVPIPLRSGGDAAAGGAP
jgi:hypothetical protein